MSACYKSALRCFVCLVGCIFLAPSSFAKSLVPAGTSGVLEVYVSVEGNGGETARPGSGLKSRTWSVSNKINYKVVVHAKAPVINGEPAAGPASAADATDEAAWEKKWEAKTAACKGDPQCEMQVAIAQASDPHSVGQMKELSAMAAAARSAPGTAPNAQVWDAVSRTGPVSVLEKDNAFGVVSETGGGTLDVVCTIATERQVNALPPNPTGTLPPILTVNTSQSTYTLYLPLEDGFDLDRSCNNGRNTYKNPLSGPSLLVGDYPADGRGWSTHLTVNGSVVDTGGVLKFEGSKVLKASVLGSRERLATVTIKWRFSAPAASK